MFGDAGDAELIQAVRAHGNFSEYVPLGLILLALVRAGTQSDLPLSACCVCMCVCVCQLLSMCHSRRLSPPFIWVQVESQGKAKPLAITG